MTTAKLKTWRTPASSYPRQQVRSAEIVTDTYKADQFYDCYGMSPAGDEQQYGLFLPERDLPITMLQVNGKTWMVDDPPHWWAMQRYGEEFSGRVLCAGLGLGLIVHALAGNNKVSSITVVERSQDVIDLITPWIPDVEIVQQDWYKFHPRPHYDCVLYDLFVGDGRELVAAALSEYVHLRQQYHGAQCRIHGFDNDKLEEFVQKIFHTNDVIGNSFRELTRRRPTFS